MGELPRYWSVVPRKYGRPEVPGRYKENLAAIQGMVTSAMLLAVGIHGLLSNASGEVLGWTLGGGLFCGAVGFWNWRRERRKRLSAEAELARYEAMIAQPLEEDWESELR